ncbi:MAG: polyprenyl diphosphate synthase [Patescibacteria group bacterium]
MTKNAKIELPSETKVPNHIAMILDGNRRWARSRGLKPWEGHYAGYDAINKLARSARSMGVHTFTVWAFSTENWDRPQVEVDEIMNLFKKALTQAKKEAVDEKVRMVHIGRRDRLPADLVFQIQELEELTKGFSEHTFNFAVDYGGHDEILRAVKRIVNDKVASTEIDAKLFESYLDTASQTYPYVDLFIRTSGEQRTSGLFPWQMDYAEYYFEQEHLPDFTSEKLKEAILDYSRRRRRFGGGDSEEHLKFDPKLAAGLEVAFRKNLNKETVIKYVKEQYGLSKQLAMDAGAHMYSALKYGEQKEWKSAKKSLTGLYEVVKRNLGLAFEPELIANFEVNLWKDGATEEKYREYFAEKFRVSEFQATKTAHLAYLAQAEVVKRNWEKARGYMEKYYQALKERVA